MTDAALEKPKLFARYTREQWAYRLLVHATIYKPEGEGPFPLVLHFHGCGGPRPIQPLYAEKALEAGYAVIDVDSFKPRRISQLQGAMRVCTGTLLHGSERAADLYALFDWARSQNWVDHKCIVAAGWSHGGWTIMDALAMGERAPKFARLTDLPPNPLEGLAGAILIYPYAAFPAMTFSRGWGSHKPKVYAVLCGKDQVVGIKHPPKALDRLEHDGVEVERLFLPDATHAFDDQKPGDPRSRYHPEYYDQTRAWYADALKAIRTRHS